MPSEKNWWQRSGKELIWSVDVVAGVVVGAGLLVGGYFYPSVVPGPSVLTTEAALGTAVLAVVLTALAILVAFLGDEYVALPEKSVSVRKAILPYQAVATVAAAQVLSALVGIIIWGIARDWGRDAVAAVTVALSVCSIIGTVQIVNITAGHGRRRARIPEIREAAVRALREQSQGRHQTGA